MDEQKCYDMDIEKKGTEVKDEGEEREDSKKVRSALQNPSQLHRNSNSNFGLQERARLLLLLQAAQLEKVPADISAAFSVFFLSFAPFVDTTAFF